MELKHCASSKTSVKSSRKYFVHLDWIRLARVHLHWYNTGVMYIAGRTFRAFREESHEYMSMHRKVHIEQQQSIQNEEILYILLVCSVFI